MDIKIIVSDDAVKELICSIEKHLYPDTPVDGLIKRDILTYVNIIAGLAVTNTTDYYVSEKTLEELFGEVLIQRFFENLNGLLERSNVNFPDYLKPESLKVLDMYGNAIIIMGKKN